MSGPTIWCKCPDGECFRSLGPACRLLSTVDQVVSELFSRPRDPRSVAYKAGVRAAVKFRLYDKARGGHIECPYKVGTAEADAFFSGVDEGHAAGQKVLERMRAGAPA